MIMKTGYKLFLLTALLFLVTGCTTVQLQGGKYAGKDRGEFAMVYGDLIFLRVKAGKNIPGSLSYWEWGGKYSVDPESRIVHLDMDREIGKLWKFSYTIYAGRSAIILADLSENKKFVLRYENPALRRKPANAPQAFSSPGTEPVFRQLAPVE